MLRKADKSVINSLLRLLQGGFQFFELDFLFMLGDETLQSQNDKLEVIISEVFRHEHELIFLVLYEGLQL